MYRESRGSLDVENSEIKTNRLKESLFSMWELLDSPGVSRAHVRSNTLFRRARLYAQLEEGNAAQRSIVRGDSHECVFSSKQPPVFIQSSQAFASKPATL